MSPTPPPRLGDATRPASGAAPLGAAEWIALALTLLWLAGAAGFFFFAPADPEATPASPALRVVTLLAIVLPVTLFWVAAAAARSARLMRAESDRLQAAVDAMRQAYLTSAPQGASGTRLPLEQRLDEIVRMQKKTEAALAKLAAARPASPGTRQGLPLADRAALGAPRPPRGEADGSQPALALGTPSEAMAEPISAEDFIRALNFPEDEHDREGFRALRRALKDPRSAGLVRSAQDILTLLAEDGIYMDDLLPDRARPEVWRRFAGGERGRTIAGLGGVRDRSSLALTAGRMRQDPVFRDCAHHFLRKFDTTFSAFEKEASDAEIAAFADTRSARAFMLIGRVSGTFD